MTKPIEQRIAYFFRKYREVQAQPLGERRRNRLKRLATYNQKLKLEAQEYGN
ncbi:hypothetical protein WD019_18955 [Fictibacillus sp. Mic-4]|uniref:hypothetical protein n=1 Tax=Fictibacillus sp. Mic-4 TaxID=3132826 RepID=UPI003CEB1863